MSNETEGFPPCDCCGDPTEENRCDHGDRLCPECISECHLCTRETAEDIADDNATERALDEWRGISA